MRRRDTRLVDQSQSTIASCGVGLKQRDLPNGCGLVQRKTVLLAMPGFCQARKINAALLEGTYSCINVGYCCLVQRLMTSLGQTANTEQELQIHRAHLWFVVSVFVVVVAPGPHNWNGVCYVW